MAIDPTGYDKALAQIQPGALSERQQRIAAGVAMVRDGASYRKASAAAKVPLKTLWEYCNHGRAIAERETKADYNVAAVTELSVDVALMAAEHVRDRLASEPEKWSNMDLVKAYGVATDKIVALSGRVQGGSHDGLSELAKLLRDAKVTVEAKPADSQAVDVEAQRVG